MTKRRFWWSTLAVALATVVLVYALRDVGCRRLARHWQREMAKADDARAVELVGWIQWLDGPGLPVLVETLGSRRECVARAARRALFAQLDQWGELDTRIASPRLARLAESLAGAVDDFGPSARLDAAELAARILRCPLNPTVIDRREVFDACELVLRQTERERRIAASTDQPPTSPIVSLDDPGAPAPAPLPSESSGPSLPSLAQLPGGNLLPVPLPKDTAVAQETPPPAEAETEPGRLPEPVDARRLAQSPEPCRLGDAGPAAQPMPLKETTPPSAGPPGEAPGLLPGLSGASPAAPLAKADALDLLRGLWSEDPDSAAEARAELIRRGFGEVDLAIGRQLFDPDVEVRKNLVRKLPGLRTARAEPWLLWLAQDASAEVRALAVGLLATTSDPAILAQVEQIARSDPDARVRRHAPTIARRRAEGQF